MIVIGRKAIAGAGGWLPAMGGMAVILFAAASPQAADDGLSSKVQQRIEEAGQAAKHGMHEEATKKYAELFALILKGEKIPHELRLDYARSLMELEKFTDALRQVDLFLKNPDRPKQFDEDAKTLMDEIKDRQWDVKGKNELCPLCNKNIKGGFAKSHPALGVNGKPITAVGKDSLGHKLVKTTQYSKYCNGAQRYWKPREPSGAVKYFNE